MFVFSVKIAITEYTIQSVPLTPVCWKSGEFRMYNKYMQLHFFQMFAVNDGLKRNEKVRTLYNQRIAA